MSRRKRRINRLVDSIIGGEMKVVGFEFDEDDVVVGTRQVTASGNFLGLGDVVLSVGFNKKVKVKRIAMSIDYSSFDGRLVQSYKFSNYKKYERASAGNYQDVYAEANNLSLQGIDYFQEAVDLYETIPGLKDLFITYYEAGYGGSSWT